MLPFVRMNGPFKSTVDSSQASKRGALNQRIAMIMMKKTFYLCLGLFLLLGSAGEAGAQMVFHLDFWQDGSYEDTWTPQIGEEAVVGIYVSNVPPPGLITMGFVLEYDFLKIQVLTASVYDVNWSARGVDQSREGLVDFTGFRVISGLSGDDILLGTVTLRCLAQGESELRLQDRAVWEPPLDPEDFVLQDGRVLDGEIPQGGVLLALVGPPSSCDWDRDGDGDVDGVDLAYFAQGPPDTADVGPFGLEFGRNDCLE